MGTVLRYLVRLYFLNSPIGLNQSNLFGKLAPNPAVNLFWQLAPVLMVSLFPGAGSHLPALFVV
jgi:hypothetical protein